MTPSYRSPSPLVRGVLVAALAVVVGVVVGHFIWSAATTARLTPSATRTFEPFRSSRVGSAFGGTGEYGSGGYGTFGPGGTNEGANSGEGGVSGEGAGSGGVSGEGGASGEGPGSSEGGSSSEGAGSNEGNSSSSTGSVSDAVTSKVDPALVDIDTDLGLEDGEAAGTGMVATSDGLVITNNHVIDGATKITARDVGNGQTYTAHVVGYDHSHDIALLQLEGASGLKTVTFAGSGSQKVGEGVATIGNAGGTGGTPTAAAGRIAALEQSITAGDEIDGSQEHLSGLIQIDGDLQPGDSGGPLVDEQGEVIGMDTAASSTFQFQSSADEGFAIPIEQVLGIAKEIHAGESSNAVHIGATGMLGVFIRGRSGEGESEGALVESVISGTPAASSGLAAGDTITAVAGSSVSTPTALTEVILQKHPGESVTLTWRTPAGAQQTATVTLASGPPQ